MVLVHPESPESRGEARRMWSGSTSQLLKAVIDGSARKTYIVATDNGLMHRMRQLAPGKTLIEAPTAGNSATCKSCAHCPWMAMNALLGVVELPGEGARARSTCPSRCAARRWAASSACSTFVKAQPRTAWPSRAAASCRTSEVA